MTRGERGLAAFVLVFIMGFVVLLASQTIVDAALASPRFSVAQGYVQLLSGPATGAAVISFLWMRWSKRCGTPWCLRLGEHPVHGTIFRVCHRHHHHEHHAYLHALHLRLHPEKLGWGESHGQPIAERHPKEVEKG